MVDSYVVFIWTEVDINIGCNWILFARIASKLGIQDKE